MQLFFALLMGVLMAGWSCDNSSTLILSLNCSKYLNSLGDTFHPYKLNGSETDYCTKCLCDETGKEATCTKVECPELDCKEVIQEEGKCCKSCDTSDQFFIFPGEHIAYCVVGGKLYTDMSLVPSVNTSDPCEVCHCCGGKILCNSIFKACPKLRCDRSQVFWDNSSCCPKCPFDPNQPHEQAVVCKQNGFTYQERDTWNPYFPKFGVIDCLNCTCTNGSINCKKLPCPPVRACTEDDPIEDITLCCPKCNRTATSPTPSQVTPTTLSVTTSPPTITLIPDPPAKEPCKSSPYKVYKSINSWTDQIAIESISNVDMYIWSTLSVMRNESYSPEQFAKNFLNVIFKYIGNTSEGRLRKLEARFNKRRMRKNLKYCQVNCAAKVIKILKLCKRQ